MLGVRTHQAPGVAFAAQLQYLGPYYTTAAVAEGRLTRVAHCLTRAVEGAWNGKNRVSKHLTAVC
jgi:hypothetical protein